MGLEESTKALPWNISCETEEVTAKKRCAPAREIAANVTMAKYARPARATGKRRGWEEQSPHIGSGMSSAR